MLAVLSLVACFGSADPPLSGPAAVVVPELDPEGATCWMMHTYALPEVEGAIFTSAHTSGGEYPSDRARAEGCCDALGGTLGGWSVSDERAPTRDTPGYRKYNPICVIR